MGPLDRLEDEYVSFSATRTSLRELLELVAGAVVFVLVAAWLAAYLVGETAALAVAAVLAAVFGITIVSQAYWAVTGREDYDDE